MDYSCESGDFVARLQPLFTIGSEISAQLIVFLNRLFQLDIHPGNFSFTDRLGGDGL